MERWIGATRSELVAEWGNPDRVVHNRPHGSILIYVTTSSYSTRGADDLNIYGSGSRGSDIPGGTSKLQRTYRFFLDNKGVIYDWSVQQQEITVPSELTEGF